MYRGDAANVFMLVMYAYNLKNFQVSGTAPLLKEENTRWDIVAKAEGDSDPAFSLRVANSAAAP
jgi:uncharacterized protein (TIGR03435 family)